MQKVLMTSALAIFLASLCLLGRQQPASKIRSTHQYILLSEPWNKYFKSTPKVLVITKPSNGILQLLGDQQALAKQVLDMSSSKQDSSDYAPLQERLLELKALIPGATTESGLVPGRSYSSNIPWRNYRYLKEKQMGSSPELAKSVENIVRNATLDSMVLGQRIDSLHDLTAKWRRRTSLMSTNGSSGIMRKANEKYLKALGCFIAELNTLKKDVVKAEKSRETIEQNRNSILQEWQLFEKNRLPVLDAYFKENALNEFAAHEDTYAIPDAEHSEIMLLMCEMGNRELYFEISDQRSDLHPFVLVDVTSPRGIER